MPSPPHPRPASWRAAALLGPCLLALACTHGPRGGERGPGVDALLETSEREEMRLSDLRGRPTLVFLFSTFDEGSQLALTALWQARPQLAPALQLLGIALQPNPRAFLGPYRDALAIDFPLAHEPAGHILAGDTPLGTPPSVPTFVLLDAGGRIAGRLVGVPTPADLAELSRRVADD